MRQAKENINRSSKGKENILDDLNFIIREGTKRKIFAKDSNIAGVPQAARKIKRKKRKIELSVKKPEA